MSDKLAGRLAKRLAGKTLPLPAHSIHDPETAEVEQLARLAEAIRRAPHPIVQDDFRRNARIRILNQVSAAAPGHIPAPKPVNFKVRLTMGLRNALFAMTIMVGFLFVAELLSFTAQNALPGDFLYPVKLGFEQAQDIFASSEEDAVLQTRFASNRLTEIQLLVVAGRYEDLEPAVAAFEANIDQAMSALAAVARQNGQSTYPILVRMTQDLESYSDSLAALQAFVPAEQQAALERAIWASQALSLPVD